MDFNFNNQTTLAVFGTRGGGKSNFVKYLTSLLEKYLILDYVRDYTSEYGKICRTPQELLKYRKYKRLIFQPYSTPTPELIETFFKIVWNNFYNYFIVCEECDRYAHSRSSQLSAFLNFINLGRHHGNGYVVISRRLSELKLDCSAYVDYIVCFFQYIDRDIDRLGKMLGKQIAEKVKTLKRYHFLLYDVRTQNLTRGQKWETFEPIKEMI